MMKPWFYNKFVCTAGKCTDNCCIGWEIDIDEDAMRRFQNVPGEFGGRLRSAIHGGSQPVFALSAGERCALLREDGLCELILNCGEGMLCDICALHPRFFNDFGGVGEAGLGLCCEEVCRLLFSSSEPLKFIFDDGDHEKISGESGKIAEFRQARNIMTVILQDRKLRITERLGKCAEYAWLFQERLENGGSMPDIPREWESVTSPECAARLLEIFGEMESVNEGWTSLLERLVQRQEELTEGLPAFLDSAGEQWRYEHIAVYSLFRHFTDSLSDGAVYGRAMLAVCMAFAAMLMDCLVRLDKGDRGEVSEWDRILNLKLLSKQVEYSQENIDMFLDEYC